MRRAIRAWAAVWAASTALALFFAVSTGLTYLSMGRPASWFSIVVRALSEWWLWAVLTPLVVWLARRFPLRPGAWRRLLAAHILAGAILAVLKTAADRVAFGLLTGFWTYLLVSTLALQFVIYAVLVAAAHGLEYYRRSREREHLEKQLAETRLQLLNMQLQPHFLFNTLNAIAELVHESPDAADRMITSLSELLRRTLELGASQEIPFGTELGLLATYLDIQTTRFGDRLDVRFSIGDGARHAMVPILLLQPIVENAIKHGIAARPGSGRLDINAHLSDGRLVIEVVDQGEGTTVGPRAPGPGIGLSNTRERLAALYGSAATIECAIADSRGARVTLRLPIRRPAEAA